MEFWQTALTFGGIAAIGAFVFFNLYKEWLTLPVLNDLTKSQKFSLMKLG